MKWTDEKIAALAPNDSAERRGRMLANSAKWEYTATNYEGIWGAFKGSGAQPYITQIQLNEQRFKCTCPVRKAPCKHILGLLFLYAKSSAVFKYQAAPEHIQQWLKAQGSSPVAPAIKSSPNLIKSDEALEKARIAKEKRWQKRLDLMAAGIEELELWLTDVVRQGIANTDIQKASFWQQTAAKMMDAKLPRVSTYLKETHQLIIKEQDWTELLVNRLGELYWWVESFKKREKLSADLQEELFRHFGKTVKKADIIADNPETVDHWLVIGKKEAIDIEGRNFRKVWLQGQNSNQTALFLEFTFGNMSYERQYTVGDLLRGPVVFYSTSYPQRAVPLELSTASLYTHFKLNYHNSISALLNAYGQALAQHPWLESFPAALQGISVVKQNDNLILIDQEQQCLPLTANLSESAIWQILAISGGHPIDLFGEWDGLYFEPLSLLTVDKIISLT